MEKLTSRIIKYILGLFIVTVGIGFAVKSNFGVSPVSAIPYTMTKIIGLEMGLGTMIFQSFLVVIQILILRKNFELKNLLQIGVSIVFGWMTTFSNYVVGLLPFADILGVRIAMILVSCVLIALGIALYVPANIVPMPSEGLIKTVADVTKKNFSDIKVIFDCTVVLISAVLCLVFIKSFGSIGFGTVVLAILVGIINKQFIKLFKRVKIIK